MKLNEFLLGNGDAGAGWSALRRAAGRYNGAVGLFNGWNCVSVGVNSYEEEEEEVFVGDEPVEIVVVVAIMMRWDEEGEDKVSWDERVEAVGTATGEPSVALGATVVEVGASGNFIFGEIDGVAIVGWAGRCCRADISA